MTKKEKKKIADAARHQRNKNNPIEILRKKAYNQKHKANSKAYYDTHKEALAAYHKAYYDTHKEAVAAKDKIYRESHKEACAAISKAWSEANPLRSKWTKVNVAAKRRGCTDRLTFDEFMAIIEAANGVCPCCHEPFGTGRKVLSFDHVIPISKGGLHAAANLQCICLGCNDKKGDKTIRYPVLPFVK